VVERSEDGCTWLARVATIKGGTSDDGTVHTRGG
jgi:hypothetical protein